MSPRNPNIEPLPGNDDDEPRPLGDGLDSVLRRLGAPTAGAMSTIFTTWAELVGPSVAAHCRPVSLQEGVLVVAVDDAAWGSQIRWLEPQLVSQVSEVVGARVERVEVRVRPD
jgi:predicted nucleic acid-binding Zn ribbon protein